MNQETAVALPDISDLGLDPKRTRALAALLACPSIESAAEQLGVTSRTIRKWIADPEFAQALRTAAGHVLNFSINRLAFATDAAVSTMIEIVTDPKKPAYVRARTAADLLGLVVRLRTLQNSEERLAEIEAKLAQAERERVGKWRRD